METYDITNTVMSKIHALDPEHALRITGYVLMQGEKEMTRLAFASEALLLSYINQAKACLGILPSSTPLSNPISPSKPFPQTSPRISIPNNGVHFSNPSSAAASFPRPITYAAVLNGSKTGANNGSVDNCYGSSSLRFNGGDQLSFLDECAMDPIMSPSGMGDSLVFPYGEDMNTVSSPRSNPFHRGGCSVNDATFLPPKYLHSEFCGGEAIEEGSLNKSISGFDEFLRMKAIQQHQRFALMGSGRHYPFAYSKCMNFMNENQRSGDFHQFNPTRPDLNQFSPMGFCAGSSSSSRQIYLTFPSDSTFKEDDVTGYFSTFGPVHDVRIPYQQKRMFGFVTFAYPETVKIILAKGNPHFVCDCRVLVKPYKEKGKVFDKKQQMERGDYAACLSPSGIDSGEHYELPFGSRMLFNTQEMMHGRRVEQETELQHAIELQGRKIMNLQLMDLKSHNHFMNLQSQFLKNQSPDISCHATSPEVSEEYNDIQEATKTPADEGFDLPESLEHILPENLFSSPTKLAAENQSIFSNASHKSRYIQMPSH